MPEITNITDLLNQLQYVGKNCEEKFLDLKTLKFEIIENDMVLSNDFYKYFFKTDPKNPKDPKVRHALTQFCKICGVPYTFFIKNPEYMKSSLVSCWLPSLKIEKTSVLAKLRKTREEKNYTIRALLPVEHTNISNLEILDAISKEVANSYNIDFVFGENVDDLILHVRFVSKNEFDVCGQRCAVGFSVVCSELGASPLIVETFLYRPDFKTAFLSTYSDESFFSFNYEKIQKTDLQSLFTPLISHLNDETINIKNKIQEAWESTQGRGEITELLRSVKLMKGLSEKFHIMLFQEIEKDDTVKSKWDFINKMSFVAKNFDITQRLKIERAAGKLLGLVFFKS
jgi:hypothetical protein